jgi:hypothetical protein
MIADITQASGRAEPEAALAMVEDRGLVANYIGRSPFATNRMFSVHFLRLYVRTHRP